MKIIATAEVPSDGPEGDDVLIASGIESKTLAVIMRNALRDSGGRPPRYNYKVVEDDYRLKEFKP